MTAAGTRHLPPYPALYDILGVDPGATLAELRRAFRALSRQHHPDVAGRDSHEFYAQITQAWSELSDADRRVTYDQSKAAAELQPKVDLSGWEADHSKPLRQTVASHIWMDYHLAPDLASTGTVAHIDVELPHGRVTVKVRIPAGTNDGSVLRIKGAGTSGENGGRSSDLFVRLHVATPARVEDIHVTEAVPSVFARDGMTITVPVWSQVTGRERQVRVVIPAGTLDGAVIRVAGKGEPGRNGDKSGDLLVRLRVLPAP
jgi:DnaJ-class molecular chaperone